MLDNILNVRKIEFESDRINSGEEFDYVNVEDGKNYVFASYNRSAVFVLPPFPHLNYKVTFTDQHSAIKWHKTKIHNNGNYIMGQKEHMECDIPNVTFKLTFIGGFIGWKVDVEHVVI